MACWTSTDLWPVFRTTKFLSSLFPKLILTGHTSQGKWSGSNEKSLNREKDGCWSQQNSSSCFHQGINCLPQKHFYVQGAQPQVCAVLFTTTAERNWTNSCLSGRICLHFELCTWQTWFPRLLSLCEEVASHGHWSQQNGERNAQARVLAQGRWVIWTPLCTCLWSAWRKKI